MNRWLLCLHLAAVATVLASLFTLKAQALGRAAAGASEAEADFAGHVREMIASPAVMAAAATGIAMVATRPALLQQPWFYLKLAFVGGLLALCRDELAPGEARRVRAGGPSYAAIAALIVMLFGIAAAVVVRPFAH